MGFLDSATKLREREYHCLKMGTEHRYNLAADLKLEPTK